MPNLLFRQPYSLDHTGELELSNEVLYETLHKSLMTLMEKHYKNGSIEQKLLMQGFARKQLYDAERKAENDEIRKAIRPPKGVDPVEHYANIMLLGLIGALNDAEITITFDHNAVVSFDLQLEGTGKERRQLADTRTQGNGQDNVLSIIDFPTGKAL